MSANSAKGYRGEVAVLDWVRFYHPDAYRPRAGSPRDVGDICGTPIVHSVKNCKAMSLSTWLDELDLMLTHSGKLTGVVWHHRRGKARADDYYVTMSGRLFREFYYAYLEFVGRGS